MPEAEHDAACVLSSFQAGQLAVVPGAGDGGVFTDAPNPRVLTSKLLDAAHKQTTCVIAVRRNIGAT